MKRSAARFILGASLCAGMVVSGCTKEPEAVPVKTAPATTAPTAKVAVKTAPVDAGAATATPTPRLFEVPATPSRPPARRAKPATYHTTQAEEEYVTRTLRLRLRIKLLSNPKGNPPLAQVRKDFAKAEVMIGQVQKEMAALGPPPARLKEYMTLVWQSLKYLEQGVKLGQTGLDLSNPGIFHEAHELIGKSIELQKVAQSEFERIRQLPASPQRSKGKQSRQATP